MKKTTLILIVSVVAVGLTIGLWTYSRATGDTISVCVKKSGLVYVIGGGFKRSDCKNSDSLLTWNIQGPKGDKGEPGPQGLAGQNIVILDSQDNEVGIYMGSFGNERHEAWNKELDINIVIDMRLMIIDDENLSATTYYESLNCEGTPIGIQAYPYILYEIGNGNKYGWTYVKTKEGYTPRVNIPTKSHWRFDLQTCFNVNTNVDGTEIQPITIPTFIPPFKIIEQ